jgi:putative PIN family toxin of toxin-antitoxin system
VQAISDETGPAGRCLSLLEAGLIEVFVSRITLQELRKVLRYPTVRDKLPGLTDQRIELFIHHLRFRGTFIRHVAHVFDYPRATQDEPYVDLAIAINATHLVSRDKDLLSLATDHSIIGKELRQRCPQLQIVNPVAFLAEHQS